MNYSRLGLVILTSAALTLGAAAETDPNYQTYFGRVGRVEALAELADGSVLIGGSFDRVGTVPRNQLARLLSSGALDPSFDAGTAFGPNYMDVLCRRMRVLSDGSIFVAGDFRTFAGAACDYAVILQPNGAFLRKFPYTRADAVKLNYFALDSGKFLLCEEAHPNNQPDVYKLTRLLPNGSIDSQFSSQAKYVSAVLELADGRLVVAASGTVTRLLAGGANDPTFTPVSFTDIAYTLVAQPDGSILVGGRFEGGIGRIGADGGLDQAFLSARGSGASSSYSSLFGVRSIRVLPDLRILAGGVFESFSGISSGGGVLLAASGAPDPSVVTPSGQILAQGSATRLVAGEFRTLLGTKVSGLAQLDVTNAVDPSFRPLITQRSFVSSTAAALQADGKILVAGNFISVNGMERPSICRFDASGGVDAQFNPSEDFLNVERMVSLPDGRLLVGTGLYSTDGRPGRPLARLLPDGTADPTFILAPDLRPGPVFDVAPSGAIVALATGGAFFSGTRIVRLSPDGSLQTLFDPVPDPLPSGLRFSRDGNRVYAFGVYYSAQTEPPSPSYSGGRSTYGVGAFLPNGQIDPSFRAGAQSVQCVTENPDSSLYVGVSQTSIQNTDPPSASRYGMARLTRSGRIDPTFDAGPNVSTVYDVASQMPGRVYTAGIFAGTVEPLQRQRTDGLVDASFAPSLGAAWSATQVFPLADGSALFLTTYPLAVRRILPDAGPPTVLRSPVSLRRLAGVPVSLGFGATGAPPLAAAWTRNSSPFSPVSDDLLTNAMSAALAGDYRVKYTNGFGSAVTSTCRLEMNLPPEISAISDGVLSMQTGFTASGAVSDEFTAIAALRLFFEYHTTDAILTDSLIGEIPINADGSFTIAFAGNPYLLGDNPSAAVSLRLYDSDDGVSVRTFRLAIRSEAFCDWASRNFTPPERQDPSVSGLAVDLTGSGLSNAAAYFWDADPRDATSPRRPVIARGSNGTLDVTYFDLVPPASGQIVEFSGDLVTWTSDPAVVQTQVQQTTPDGRRRQLKARYVGPATNGQFLRFRFDP